MIEIFLEFIVIVFGKKGYKKVKKWVKGDNTKKKDTSKISNKEKGSAVGSAFPSCTGCNQILKEPPVYEQGKPWCHKCYKTQVLKLR